MIWILVFIYTTILVAKSSSSESLEMQQFQQNIPKNSDELGVSPQRYHQIMQEPDGKWRDQKNKSDKINVKEELEKLNISYVYQPEWPDKDKDLGGVAAVAFDRKGNLVVFHRGPHVWSANTFDKKNKYSKIDEGPIRVNTIVAFDRQTGKVTYEWGKNLFYMPHGLTIDHENNVWVTDVALHQVMKFDENHNLLMTLGEKFEPGRTSKRFCKPTSVAVLQNKDFFVADGYCNSRIMKFSGNGEFLLEWGYNTFAGRAYDVAPESYFAIPHALTLANMETLLCVADRENGRIQCFYTTNGTFHSQYHSPIIGDRLFSVDYSPVEGGRFFVVNGPEVGFEDLKIVEDHQVRGFVIDMKTKKVLSKFGPNDLQFSNPHDIVVSEDGNEIYVAEIDPMRVYKFLSKSIAKNTVFISMAKPTTTISASTENVKNITMSATPSGSTALYAVTLVSICGMIFFGIALLISRSRKRGCLPPGGTRNRRHAWDFPTVKPDGFKLGNLLDRKRGFEKLDQNASDEEPDASTTMLSSAQFA